MRADARAAAGAAVPRDRALMDEPILQPIYDLETPHMAFGRVAIIGDAAFVARPHVGAGVSKAADDAVALAEALGGTTMSAALRRFEAERLPVGRRIIERARHLGAYLQATRNAEEEARAGRHTPRGGDQRNGDAGFLVCVSSRGQSGLQKFAFFVERRVHRVAVRGAVAVVAVPLVFQNNGYNEGDKHHGDDEHLPAPAWDIASGRW